MSEKDSKLLGFLTADSESFDKLKVALAEHHHAPNVPNPDWDPLLHPKDKEGKFVKTGTGVFLFGKTKKATFTLGGQKKTVAIHAGEKASKVSKLSGKEWLVVEHADGTFSAIDIPEADTDPGLHGTPINDGLHQKSIGADSNLAKAASPGKETPPHLTAKEIQSSPVTEIHAESASEAAQKLNDPTGKTTVKLGGSGKQTTLEKNQKAYKIADSGITVITTDGVVDDVYFKNGDQVPDEQVDQEGWAKLVKDEGLEIQEAPPLYGTLKESTTPKTADLPGSTVTGKNTSDVFTKTKDGWIAESGGIWGPTLVQGLIDQGSTVAVPKEVTSDPSSYLVGTKVQSKIGTPYTKIAVDQWKPGGKFDGSKVLSDEEMAPMFQSGNAELISEPTENLPPTTEAQPVTAESVADLLDSPVQAFTHPKSGAMAVDVAAVFQHKKSTDSYLVQTKSGSWLFFDKNGKVKPASQKIHLDHIDNYAKVSGAMSAAPSVSAPVGGKNKSAPAAQPLPPADFTLPDGTVIKMTIGMTVYEQAGNYVVFNPDGSGFKMMKNGTTTPYIGKKDHYKSWNVVAQVPLPKLKGPDLSNVQADTLPTTLLSGEHVITVNNLFTYVNSRKEKLRELTQSGFSYVHKQTVPKNTSPFHPSHDNSEAVKLLASKEFRDLVDASALTLQDVSKVEGLEKSEKMAIGKDRSRFELLGVISRFASKLQNPESDAQEMSDDWALISAKLGQKHNMTFGSEFPIPNNLQQKLDISYKSWQFKQQTKDLGFDPDTASLEVLSDFASKKGFPAVGGLTESSAKQWVKAEIGDPSLQTSKVEAQQSVLNEAQVRIASAAASIFLKQSLTKVDVDPVKKQAHEKAIAAQQKALLNQAKNLQSAYSKKVTAAGPMANLTRTGTDEWAYVEVGNLGAYKTLTDVEALELIKSGGWETDGKTDYQQKWAALISETGVNPQFMSSAELNTLISERGGKYLGKMSVDNKAKWLRAWASGDEASMYFIEHSSAGKSNVGAGVLHKEHAEHPGSWGSPQGMAYRQVLSDYLHTQPWFAESQKVGGTAALETADINKAWNALQLDRYAFVEGYTSPDPPTSVKRDVLSKFIASRGSLPAASFDPADLQLQEESNDAPEGHTQDAWNMVLATEKGAPDVLKVAASFATSGFSPSSFGTSPLQAQFIPDDIKKLGVWSMSGSDSTHVSETKAKVRMALSKRIADGKYIPVGVPQWKDPSGKQWPIAEGSKIYKLGANHYVVSADGSSGVSISPAGSSAALGQSSIANLKDSEAKIVYAFPVISTFEKAKADGLNVDEFTWKAVEDVEGKEPADVTLPGVTMNEPTLLYTLKNSKNVPGELKANVEKLPLNVKMLAAWAVDNDPPTLSAIAYKLKSGHYAQLQMKPLVDPESPFGQKIAQGWTSADNIYSSWGTPAMVEFDKVYGTLHPAQGTFEHAEAIEKKITELFNPNVSALLDAPPTTTVFPKNLQLTPLQKSLGGMHSKKAWTDQGGNEWMSKAFPSDPNSKARVDAEHNANVIGRMFGFRNPETRVMALGGQYSYVQHLKPATGSLGGKSMASMSDEQLAQAMEEHVLDWLVSNHDSHPDNLLLDPNGKDIIGIDKGQAWRFFPDDKLSVGYKASNPVHVWYDQFYKAVQSGAIDKKRADYVTRRVLVKSMRVAAKHDAEFQQALEDAHKNRTNFPAEFPTREKFIEGILARKKGIAGDFDAFYKGLYKQAGWDYDFDLEKLQGGGKYAGHIHTGISQEFADDVKKSLVHGKSVMLSTDDLEDAHFLWYTEKSQSAQEVLRAETRLRQNADVMLTAWLKAQTIENNYTSHTMNVPVSEKHADLPGNSSWWGSILSAAKTVNHHAGDGDYNVGTLATMEQSKQQMQNSLEALEAWESKNPDKPYSPTHAPGWSGNLVTKEQQDAWKEMLKSYLKDIESVEAAKAVSGKVVPKVSQINYTPSAGLDTKNFLPKGVGSTSVETSTEDEVISNVVMLAGHPVKVTKHPSYGTKGDFDEKSGVLTESGTTNTGFYGSQYDIEVGGVKIEYRPWSEPGVLSAQKGLLKVRHEDWDGQSQPMELVFDILKEIGLTLDDADEESLELFYWKQQYGVSLDRLDNDSKYKSMQTHVKQAFTAKPDMDKEEQLQVMREAWAKVIGKGKVDSADWSPKFDKLSVVGTGGGQGKPYWTRSDYTLDEYKKLVGGKVPASSTGSPKDSLKIALSGYLPTEERARIITDIYVPGGYNSQQRDTKNGASGFVFSRQNMNTEFGRVYFHPSVGLRTTNYAFNSDTFGDTAQRASRSPADLSHSTKFNYGGNELMIKNGIGYTSIAAIRFPNESDRQEAIKHFKDNGITEIHGIPVDELFVTSSSGVQSAVTKVWEAALKFEKALGDMTVEQRAAYYALVAAGMSPAQAILEAKQL